MLISLIVLLVRIPRLFRDLTTVICTPATPSLLTATEFIPRARKLRADLKTWYRTYIGPDETPIVGSDPRLGDGFYKVLLMFYLCSIYSNRTISSFYWKGTSDIDEIEEETQRFARTIVSFCEGESDFQSSLILAQKLPIAEATLDNSEQWKQEWRCQNGCKQNELFKVPEYIFEQWCHRFGRKTS